MAKGCYKILPANTPAKAGDEYLNSNMEWKKIVTMFGYPIPDGVKARRLIESKKPKDNEEEKQ